MANKRILVVDDEKDITSLLRLRLEASGYDVLEAYDGQEALKIAQEESPDLIVLDLMLPKMDGYKVCRMLKFDERFKHIPIIIFTARIQESDQKMGMEVGADAYVTKPFEPQVLMAKIQELITQE